MVGADLARRHGESAADGNAIAAHHDEVPPETVEAVLVQVADAISAARPGRAARSWISTSSASTSSSSSSPRTPACAGAGHVRGP